MDQFDQKILAALQSNARQSVSQIAAQVNLSRSAVSERIKRMEENGDILGYSVITAPQEPAKTVKAYFEVRHQGYHCHRIADVMLQFPEVKHCHAISGAVDIFVYLEAPHIQRLHEIRYQVDKSLPKNVTVITHIVLQEQW